MGPIKVRDDVKINAASYCDLLDEVLVPWLDNQTLALCKKLVFMQDNAPAHSARVMKQYLADLGIEDKNLMIWPPNSPDLNPIENFWSIIKHKIYTNNAQFSSKQGLWEAIERALKSVDVQTIKNLTESINNCIFDVIKCQGRYINK